MNSFKKKRNNKNTIKIMLFIVFFCVIFLTSILYIKYNNLTNQKTIIVINNKIDKVLYQFFSDLITDKEITNIKTNNLLKVIKNKNDEIVTVDYDIEQSYNLLSNISNILKEALLNLENGHINIDIYDDYFKSSKFGIIFNMPLFLGSNNIIINSLGPKIPIKVSFNNSLLTNIKTKVTDYGLNNALLEIYVTIEIKKILITPVNITDEVFNYDILIGAKVVSGSVPNYYGLQYESTSKILNLPLNSEL